MPLFDQFSTKKVLLTAMTLQCTALLAFTMVNQFAFQAAARFLSGFSQVILTIFLPVWVDAYAPRDRQTKWMTYIISAAPLGLLTGYSMSAVIVTFGIAWQWAFYIHIVLLIPFIAMILIMDPETVDIGRKLANQQEYEIANIEGPHDQPTDENDFNQNMTQMGDYERFNAQRIQAEEIRTKNFSFYERVGYILSNSSYLLLMLSITSLFVVMTGIQFWCTDFFISIMKIPQREAFRNFAISCAIGPISGVIASGQIFDRIGGYNSQRALPIINAIGFIAMVAASCTIVLADATCMTIFSFIEGFCGGILMPAVTGIMLNQVPASMRTVCNSIANLSYNLFGYVPAPYLYGHFQQQYGGRSGLFTIQSFSLLSYLLLVTFTVKKHI